jgi:hypothetical protein
MGCFIGARFAQNGKKIPTFTASIRLLRDRLGYEQRKEMEAPLGGSNASARRGGGPICRPEKEKGGSARVAWAGWATASGLGAGEKNKTKLGEGGVGLGAGWVSFFFCFLFPTSPLFSIVFFEKRF